MVQEKPRGKLEGDQANTCKARPKAPQKPTEKQNGQRQDGQ
jgi:hypothetical protein